MERISIRGTNLEILSSFDLIITSMDVEYNESMSVSVNRNGHRGSIIDLPGRHETDKQAVRALLRVWVIPAYLDRSCVRTLLFADVPFTCGR